MVNKILNLFFNDKAIFKFSKSKQLDYMNCLGSPKDEIDRSFFQYKCQMKHLNIFKRAFLNLVALIAMLFCVSRRKQRVSAMKEKISNIFLFVHDEQNVPSQYQRDKFLKIEDIEGEAWTADTEKYYVRIRSRYRFHPFFLLKIYKKLAFYQFLICTYSPENIITSNEYSFTSSIMTGLCNELDIKHIDVMHGEKLFYFGDSFFYFHKVYVWDEYYIDLFKELRAEYDEIEVYFPKERFVVPVDSHPTIDITYYLQMQTKKEMITVRNALLSSGAEKIAIRPHPRYTDMKTCKSVFGNFEIEDSAAVSIKASLARTQSVVSVFSTVLLQAECSNIAYYIDDLSDNKRYKQLKDLNYRLIHDNEFSKLQYMHGGKNGL